jgi:hypothetical protein
MRSMAGEVRIAWNSMPVIVITIAPMKKTFRMMMVVVLMCLSFPVMERMKQRSKRNVV